MMNKTFPGLLEYFVVTYVRKEAGLSKDTLRSYYTAMEQYVNWLFENEGVTIDKIDVSFFNKDRIRLFLLYLEEEKNISITTRNLRRAGIVAFLAFAAESTPVYANSYIEAQTIRIKQVPKSKKTFLTVEEYRALLQSIDITRRKGFDHYLLISVLYDTAARVDEIVKLNIENFSFGSKNTVIIYGKGSKYRIVYLTTHTVNLIKKYKQSTGRENGALFLNKNNERISDSGVDYILKKYATLAINIESSIKNKIVSPHVIRRSKASHMLLNGASLPVIQRFLGHASIKTTEAYLEVGSETMVKAVEAAGKLIFQDEEPSEQISSWKDPNILNRLKRLTK